MSQITFQANFLSSTKVVKQYNGVSKQINASFIELNPHRPNDMQALNSLQSWVPKVNKDKYVPDKMINRRIFAITEQQNHFEKPEPQSILGLAFFSEFGKRTNDISKIVLRKDVLEPVSESKFSKFSKFLNNLFGKKQENPKQGFFQNVLGAFIEVLQGRYEAMSVCDCKKVQHIYEEKGFKPGFLENELRWERNSKTIND